MKSGGSKFLGPRAGRATLHVAPTAAVSYAAPAPLIERCGIRACRYPHGACSIDRIRGSITCRHLCSTSSSDRVCVILTCRCPCSAVASSPTGTCAAPAPVIEFVASSPAAHAAPTPVSQHVAPTPAATDVADLSRMNKEQLTLAAAAAAASMTTALAEAEAAMKVDTTLA